MAEAKKKTCFVAMGFGKKTDYQTGRVLDLDKSYQYMIKPAVEASGLECKRADEIIHSGLIDVPMYEQLLTADVVIADISTSNVNAFYELGVRHALRPYTTITIAEDKMVFAFDISHLAIRKYQHLGDGIDFGEVMRMRTEITAAIQAILDKPQSDSPVYTFFTDLEPPVRRQIEKAVAQSAPAAAQEAANMTISDLMTDANAAMDKSDFVSAKALMASVRRMIPNDPYVVQRLALATYKAKLPSPLQALEDAAGILSSLNPAVSTDTETLGLWGAIHKREWDLTKEKNYLEGAISAYEKGFILKNDYYNGINLAFLYNVRASVSSGAEAIADTVTAQRIRQRVLAICETLLAANGSMAMEPKYWLLATMAEACAGLGDMAGEQKYLQQANALNPPEWMIDSTNQQLQTLRSLMKAAPESKTLHTTP